MSVSIASVKLGHEDPSKRRNGDMVKAYAVFCAVCPNTLILMGVEAPITKMLADYTAQITEGWTVDGACAFRCPECSGKGS